MFKDMREIEVKIGDIIVYGKSNRYNPINIGKVVAFDGSEIVVQGKGNTRVGRIMGSWGRFVIVPNSYWEEV